MKKIILFFSILFFIFSSVYGDSKKQSFGPTSKPEIVGPKTKPPTKEEIKKMKCEKDNEFIGTDICKIEKNKKKSI